MDDEELGIGWIVGGAFAALALLLALIGLLGGYGAVMGRVFGQYNEETRRLVQEESRAYQEGAAQNLDKLCLEWERTGNSAVAQSIRHRAAGYNGELPDHVQQCVNLARNVK